MHKFEASIFPANIHYKKKDLSWAQNRVNFAIKKADTTKALFILDG